MMTTEFTAADALLQEARAVIFDKDFSSTALKIAGEKAIAAKSQYEAFSQTTLASRAAITIGTGSLGEIDAALDKVEMTAKVAARRAEMAGHIAAEGSRTGHQRAEVEAARKRGANAPLAARAEKLEIAVAAYPSAAKRIIQLLRADAGVRGAAPGAIYYAPDFRSPNSASSMSVKDIAQPPLALSYVRERLQLPGFWPTRDNGFLDGDRLDDSDPDKIEHEKIVSPLRVKGVSTAAIYDLVRQADVVIVTEYEKACKTLAEMVRLDRELVGKEIEVRYSDGGLVFGRDRFPHWTPGRMKLVLPSPLDGRDFASAA